MPCQPPQAPVPVSYTHLDVYKRQVGDQLLCHIAKRLLQLAGPHDMAARLGGDEFVVMMPGLDTTESVAIEQAMACLLYTSRCV